jgi:hypothetical protein
VIVPIDQPVNRAILSQDDHLGPQGFGQGVQDDVPVLVELGGGGSRRSICRAAPGALQSSVGSSPIAPTKFEVHSACPKDVATGGSNASRQKKPRRNLAMPAKCIAAFKSAPDAKVSGAFFLADPAGLAAARPDTRSTSSCASQTPSWSSPPGSTPDEAFPGAWILRLRFASRRMTRLCHPARSRRIHAGRGRGPAAVDSATPRGMTGWSVPWTVILRAVAGSTRAGEAARRRRIPRLRAE